ncbi:MAG: hypothetical protein ACRC62_17065 [Microcoleus sp.]
MEKIANIYGYLDAKNGTFYENKKWAYLSFRRLASRQSSNLNYQLSIDRERGRSHYNYQRSTINSQLSTDKYSCNNFQAI